MLYLHQKNIFQKNILVVFNILIYQQKKDSFINSIKKILDNGLNYLNSILNPLKILCRNINIILRDHSQKPDPRMSYGDMNSLIWHSLVYKYLNQKNNFMKNSPIFLMQKLYAEKLMLRLDPKMSPKFNFVFLVFFNVF